MPSQSSQNTSPPIRMRDAQELASGYSRQYRWVEICAILTFFGFMIALVVKLWSPAVHAPWLALTAVLLGYIAADFISGFVHWLADTWGSADMAVLGKAFIRPFREHHVDQEAITHHDFIETNGNNCLVSLAPAVAAMFVPTASLTGMFAVVFLTSLILWVFLTNQLHKWSHTRQPPRVISWMQKLHLILPPAHHAVHHSAPFNRYYCITVGWLNWPLYKIRFFQSLEWTITALTGMLPRQDDIGEEAARAIAPASDGGSVEAENRAR